jgi:hypothetical protein
VASRATLAAIAVLAAATAGCKSEKTPPATRVVLHANGPDWVNIGTGAVTDESGKRFQGVGIVSGVRDAALRRRIVDSRARTEIQRTLEDFLDGIEKDLPSGTAAAERQRVETAFKAVATSDSGVHIVDHWVDTDSTEYALAELDLASFKSSLEKAKDLDARAKETVRRDIDRLFDETSAEKASHAARR